MAHNDQHIRIRGVRLEAGDLKRLGRALVELARAQAEADAEAEAQQAKRRTVQAAATTREQAKQPAESAGEAA